MKYARVPGRRMRTQAGFTMIEMLVVLTVIAILALATLPVAELVQKRARERDLRLALFQIRESIDAYKRAADSGQIAIKADASKYPATLQSLVDGVDDAKDPRHPKLYFLRRIPRDPFADHSIAPAQTWGFRSYASPADRPRAGDDVYDVYSLAPGSGLNGLPYREW